ncbi:hypothetical protein PV367_12620 [Streptomyces europaeiscabiei]|uniref:Uncharacterized protein n=1 Tax=Streptomyces europaeiscabiei TaxID=146819 RepID=A0AAJ2UKT6_9ACTN|nr:hypothetical protein [Streptomyces europaeiscabiei]MDX3130618.1 hypothetical protein [Streptomyces europaeiscabiei]
MKHLTAICTGTPDGYRIRVLAEDHDGDLVDLVFGWDSFRPASAGHRLIEHGYMIRPDARTPDTVNGWREVPGQPGTWSVPVMPTNGGAPVAHPMVSDHLVEAVTHWTEGRHDEAQEILAELARNGTPSLMYGVATGLAVMAKAALAKMQGLDADTAFWIILTSDGSRPEDIVPQPHLFAARFITAFAKGDTATTLALYGAAFTAPDPELFSHFLEMLLAATGEAVRAATPGADR